MYWIMDTGWAGIGLGAQSRNPRLHFTALRIFQDNYGSRYSQIKNIGAEDAKMISGMSPEKQGERWELWDRAFSC